MKKYRLKESAKPFFDESVRDQEITMDEWVGSAYYSDSLEEVKDWSVKIGCKVGERFTDISQYKEGKGSDLFITINRKSRFDYSKREKKEIPETIEKALNGELFDLDGILEIYKEWRQDEHVSKDFIDWIESKKEK